MMASSLLVPAWFVIVHEQSGAHDIFTYRSLAMAAGVALAAVFAGSRRDWRAGREASLSIGATGRHPAAVRERVVASKAPTEPLRLRFRTCR